MELNLDLAPPAHHHHHHHSSNLSSLSAVLPWLSQIQSVGSLLRSALWLPGMNPYHILADELIAAAAVSPDSISASQRREEIKQGSAWMHEQIKMLWTCSSVAPPPLHLVKLSAANLKYTLCHLG